jgi:chromosome segregation ATPase
MVRLREITVIKDPSLLNEKIGPLKIRKLLPLALGGMLGYGMIKKGMIDDIVLGVIIIIASLIIAFGPERSLSLENQLQAMLYYYTLKPKGARIGSTLPSSIQTQSASLSPKELEARISELKHQMGNEEDVIKRMKIKKELLSYELQCYTYKLSDVEQRIRHLKDKMKRADKATRSKISLELKKLNKIRSELYKSRNKINAELKKFENVTLIDNEEINELKKKAIDLKSQIKITTDKGKLKELKEQYKEVLLEYYNKKILQDKAVLKLINDKALRSKINAELKELYKKKSELEKKLKKGKTGTSQSSGHRIMGMFKW